MQDKPVFDDFYRTDFQQVANDCGCDPRASKIITLCRSLGLRTILATNPVFPALATESRIRWAGLNQQDFELITTYENSSHCKPNPAYYEDILRECKLSAEECLMVGNDAEEDGIAASLGMRNKVLQSEAKALHQALLYRIPNVKRLLQKHSAFAKLVPVSDSLKSLTFSSSFRMLCS